MPLLPSVLRNRLWHSTTPARYQLILASGAILPEPEMPDSARWGTAQGPEFYPYVRFLGGVSLFDFSDFDEKKYEKKFPLSNWHSFVPQNELEGNKVWLEIDPARVGDSLFTGKALLQRWKKEEAYKHKVMPEVEAAHMGPVPLLAVAQVLLFSQGKWSHIAKPSTPSAAAA